MDMRRSWVLTTAIGLALGAMVATLAVGAAAAGPGVGFLAAETSVDAMGPESRAAWALARELASATLVLPTAEGAFADENGEAVSLDRFTVVWHHQGDRAEQTTAVYDLRAIQALRGYVASGHGLYLSGAALAMVNPMGIETAPARLGGGGEGEYLAGLIPTVSGHPVFERLERQGVDLPASVGGNERVSSVPINEAGYPAYSDFHGSKGPVGGMLLARGSAGAENPLVEYAVGKGRVIAMGWRLPRYAHAENAHRGNLERLTGNILTYLGDAGRWQEVVIGPAQATPVAEPGVSENRWRALAMAVGDLAETFGDDYPKGREYMERLAALKRSHEEASGAEDGFRKIAEEFAALEQEALLANPLLDFGSLLLVERGAGRLGLPANWQSNSSLPKTGYDNRIAMLRPIRPDGELTTVYRPEGGQFVGDVDLDFDADRMLFSMPGSQGQWRVFEAGAGGSHPAGLGAAAGAPAGNQQPRLPPRRRGGCFS